MIMYDQVHQKALEFPDAIALTLNDKHITYKQLIQNIDEATRKLQAINLKAFDNVVIVLPNIIEHVVLFYALNRLKVTIISLHPLSSPAKLKQQINEVNAKKVIVLDALLESYHGVIPKEDMIVVSIADSYEGIKRFILRMRYGLRYSRYRFSSIKASKLSKLVDDTNNDAVILFSSGTTGKQKGICLSNDAFIALADQIKELVVFEPKVDSMYCVLPFFHGFGLGVTLHSVLALGGRCVLIPRLEKRTMIHQLLKEKPSYIAGVPYLYRLLLQDPSFQRADLSFIKRALVGGELVSSHLVEQFNELLSKRHSTGFMQVGYGATETLSAVTGSDAYDQTPNCVGKPFKGNSIIIVDKENNQVEAYEHGEICIAGPILMNGYYKDKDLTRKVLQHHHGQCYYHSGDVGYQDEENNVYFSYRMNEMIKINGYFINPLEVEDAMYQMDEVMEVKVFKSKQGTLCAMMVLHDIKAGGILQEKTAQALKDLDHWNVPKHYYVVAEIPKNDMRKVDVAAIIEFVSHSKETEFLLEWSL